MNVVALYKTFSGPDFLPLSLESIYPYVNKIVMVHSKYSWTGQVGNTVAPAAIEWKAQFDTQGKILQVLTDISTQNEQYMFGLDFIRQNCPCDYILLIDSDEVWEEKDLKKLFAYAEENKDVPAFSISLHTYIKSMFYKITPKEWCTPTVLIKSSVTEMPGARGHLIPGKMYCEDVYMHHFTYVRFKEEDVFKKIETTTATENVPIVNMTDWINNKWRKLPFAKNFHTVTYAATSWKEVSVVKLSEMPKVVLNHPEIYQRFLGTDSPLLRPCSRVGINVTWKCNWGCETCFYRFNDSLHSLVDEDLESLISQVSAAKRRGCDHVVMVGFGEPSLYSRLNELVTFIDRVGMTSSMITNGATNLKIFERMYEIGMNHLHVSVHALGDKLDRIANREGAGRKQAELKKFLKDNKLPWRTNTTIQALNYQELPQIIEDIVEHGAFHIVLLGFLPHYEWSDRNKANLVIIPPKDLRPYIEQTARFLIQANKLFTIRYHPLCHLSPDLWKYVTNAQYVLYDPWEWEYNHAGEDPTRYKTSAMIIGRHTSIKTEPCIKCRAFLHCGGWNDTYAKICNGADLKAIQPNEVPEEYRGLMEEFGGLHVLNPANRFSGHYDKEEYETFYSHC